jgi:hypothetical protein
MPPFRVLRDFSPSRLIAAAKKEDLPCAAGPQLLPASGFGLLGRNAAERAKKFLCRAYGA